MFLPYIKANIGFCVVCTVQPNVIWSHNVNSSHEMFAVNELKRPKNIHSDNNLGHTSPQEMLLFILAR